MLLRLAVFMARGACRQARAPYWLWFQSYWSYTLLLLGLLLKQYNFVPLFQRERSFNGKS